MRGSRGRDGGKKVLVTSDDDEAVDTTSQGFFHDEVDEFVSNKEKILLDGASDIDEGHKTWEDDDEALYELDLPTSSSEGEEEALTDEGGDESDDEEGHGGDKGKDDNDEDLESVSDSEEDDDDEEAGLPSRLAWGKQVRAYRGTDFVDKDTKGAFKGEEEELAALEEQEAIALRKKHAATLLLDDFDILSKRKQEKEKEKDEKEVEHVRKDLSQMTEGERLQLLRAQAPDLLSHLSTFKEYLLMLQHLLEKEGHQGLTPKEDLEKTILYRRRKKRQKVEFSDTLEMEEVEEPLRKEARTTGEVDMGDEKRAITYEIAKNKGLTPHKKKELRNPRVKHRMKFRRAKIRRRGQVREPRLELQRYGGEISGIRAGVVKSVKIK
ncbi:unnamed protein product [Darwinula stevensoni]|uniref:Sas10 C-terminal domain-containing protein n=1 Tax=Darwinula stevensoni TaxID=69355 RepID=A0A7R8X1B7_9CRUS|nr:unnamed protein product [Darwinula stevensoni]CAG0882106.1 unnamed protein product [Darwinula stevensoni]